LPSKAVSNFLEIAGGNAAQVKRRQKRVQAFGAPRPLRQDRRRIANARVGAQSPTIASLRLLNFDRPNAGLYRANRIMPVSNDALAAIRQLVIGMRGHEGVEFRLHRLGDQPTGPRPKDFRERVIDFVWLAERNNLIL
jgi:hypothetical protein